MASASPLRTPRRKPYAGSSKRSSTGRRTLAMALSDPDASRAVLIGVHSYTRLPDLPAVEHNLTDLHAALTDDETWGLPDEHCRVVDQPRDAEEILEAVIEAGRQATDTLLVYYAGHGLTDPDSDELHLTLPGSNPVLSATALRFEYFRRAIRNPQIRAPRKVVILDCCYSGRALEGGMGTDRANQTVTEGSHVLTASDATKRAWSPPGETHTAFTGEILRVLTEGIPDGPELLSTDAIYRHVYTELRAKDRPLPQQANRNAGGDILIARNRALSGTPLLPRPHKGPKIPARIVLYLAIVVTLAAAAAISWHTWNAAKLGNTALPHAVQNCRTADTAPAGAAAAYSCQDRSGRPAAVAVYPDRATLDGAYEKTLDGAEGTRSTGDCATEENAEHRYPVTGTAEGRVLCFSRNASTFMVWTDENALALVRIEAPAAELRALRDSWSRLVATPPPFATADERKLIDLPVATECARAAVSELDDFPGAVAAVTCAGTGGAGAQSVTYFQFDSTAKLQQTMNDHLPDDRDPTSVGCEDGKAPKFTGGRRYDVRGVFLGVLLCHPAVDGNLVVEWSVEPLLVAGRAIGSDATSLADWWRADRGPPIDTVVQAVNRRDAFPNAAERALLERIPAPSRRNCMRPSGEFRTEHVGTYPVTAGVVCGPTTAPAIVFYYQFENKKDLTDNYNPSLGPPGNCTASTTKVTGEAAYSRGGTTGRLRCEDREGYLARFWTDERRLIYGLAFQGRDARAMSDWWEHDAGPL
ncbi:caspase domain-containing protein [Micromonospora sp. NPDC048830]|uniref:caspase family protein n=1 Tax=Micromonospora sp. NPDC048830 TaxID=3364257 RepID=UPI00371EAA8D